MTNCITCRYNDKKAKYCPVKKVHTDLGYVLNCVVWAPTDKAEIKRLHAENTKLRKLAEDLHTLAYNVLPERKSDYITICSVESCIDYYLKTMPLIEQRMRKLGVKITK